MTRPGVLTEDKVKRSAVSGGIVAIALAGLLALGLWALQQHNASAASHPDIRAARAQSRAETAAWRKEMRDGFKALRQTLSDTKAMVDAMRMRDDDIRTARRQASK